MEHKHIATYLNDHVAGSVTILDLLAHLASAYAGTGVERFATELRAEVIADRQELEALMGRLGVGQSPPRKASAWLAEKFTRLKLRMDDRAGGAFRLFEALKAVSLGVEGKRLLWLALSTVSEHAPELRGPDYEDLVRRAEDQRGRVEALRRETAKAALVAAPSP